jgi:hypothetical protein
VPAKQPQRLPGSFGRHACLSEAAVVVDAVEELLKLWDDLRSLPHTETEILDTIKTYQRDVLREQTLRS